MENQVTEKRRLENYTRYLFIHRQKDRREDKGKPKEKIIEGRREERICA